MRRQISLMVHGIPHLPLSKKGEEARVVESVRPVGDLPTVIEREAL